MNAKLPRILLPLAGLLLLSAQAQAEPTFARYYKQQYGYALSCNACHKDGGGSPLNPFGQQFKEAGKNPAAFDKIAKLDADGDGFSNGDEAQAKSNPGNKSSTPKSPGVGAQQSYAGSRRLISRAASAASASTSEPRRSQPMLASPLIVS